MLQLNAHEITALVIALIAFSRQQTTNKDTGKSPVDGVYLLVLAVVLAEGLSWLVGGAPWRELTLRGVQVLVESVGGIATVNYVAGKVAAPVAVPTPPAS